MFTIVTFAYKTLRMPLILPKSLKSYRQKCKYLNINNFKVIEQEIMKY